MNAIETAGSVAAYAATRPAQPQAPTKAGASSEISSPSVSVSSASQSFSGYGDLILSSASKGSDMAATPDGDESPSGSEVNDGDADDATANTPSLSFSDAGTYSLSVAA
ncbi:MULTISPECIES: hypothetical protein [Alphaproteobacteria]|uniref:Uncharacterized protein n=2 Tax=Alphaproteobacteria TaxID=28211 RepID=A0A512HGQ4_9HYPH|nr:MULTISPECIES: hypothetical protein [Alphaproteobacteria]GEO84622.1 hypothetical protein RNA01_15540 [Ciceribacter naphthalenivorans]GLR22585.1 hypothetical protein GCM10007920_23720 [Ciceribacter naphthalenivorans]GLT05441.1 hypothetical protein GCM10007926_23720 [Sphingomonas psychrolutea]